MNLEAFIIGCGGMMPLPGRHLTSVLLRREGDLFLFDGGEGTQVSLRKLNIGWKKIKAIFVSHMHADHVTGIPGLLMLSSQVDREEPLYIIGPPRLAEYIYMNREVLNMYINYEIIVKEITEGGIVYTGEGFSVRSFPLKHSKPCFGYTLEEPNRPGAFYPEKALECGVPRGPLWSKLQSGEPVHTADGRIVFPQEVLGEARPGRKFSFVTDSLSVPHIASEVKNSDLLVCEGMFEQNLAETAWEKKHMTAVQAAHIAREATGVQKLALIHYSPRYTDYGLEILLKEARAIFPRTVLSHDGMCFPIEYQETVYRSE
ncbi:MAG: ribonuclease Z [Treponema sp.]|jgi:ribonuclease Z|nr:ribonuclease Z [Treponema sp.]